MVQEINNLVAENQNVLPSQTVTRVHHEPAPETAEVSAPEPPPEEISREPAPDESQSSMPQSVVDTYA